MLAWLAAAGASLSFIIPYCKFVRPKVVKCIRDFFLSKAPQSEHRKSSLVDLLWCFDSILNI